MGKKSAQKKQAAPRPRQREKEKTDTEFDCPLSLSLFVFFFVNSSCSLALSRPWDEHSKRHAIINETTYLRRSAALRRTRSARASPDSETIVVDGNGDDGDVVDGDEESPVSAPMAGNNSASAEAKAAVFCCCLPESRSSDACVFHVIVEEAWNRSAKARSGTRKEKTRKKKVDSIRHRAASTRRRRFSLSSFGRGVSAATGRQNANAFFSPFALKASKMHHSI